MRPARDFLTSLLGAGAMPSSLPVAWRSQALQPDQVPQAADTTRRRQRQPPRPRRQPPQAVGRARTIDFVIDTDPIDFDPLLSRASWTATSTTRSMTRWCASNPGRQGRPVVGDKWTSPLMASRSPLTSQRCEVSRRRGVDAESVKWNIDR